MGRHYDVIERLRHTPFTITRWLLSLEKEVVHYKPDAATFSIAENVAHLRDVDTAVFGARVMRMLTEDNPHLPLVDTGQWAWERKYNEQSARDNINNIYPVRCASLELLRHVQSEKEWQRTGRIGDEKPITIADLIKRWLDHDLAHIRDIIYLLPNRPDAFEIPDEWKAEFANNPPRPAPNAFLEHRGDRRSQTEKPARVEWL